MNALPKYVVSTTSQELSWNNARVLKGSLHEAVANLKKGEVEQDIVVHAGSAACSRIRWCNWIWSMSSTCSCTPSVLGAGQRLFHEGTQTKLELVEAKTFEKGVTALLYRRPTA